jgi:hypothetical protein
MAKSSWKERAERLRRANAAVNLAADRRRLTAQRIWDTDDPSWSAWEEAVDVFWSAWAATYTPQFTSDIERLQAGDLKGVESGIEFLEADPICFRSGYVKGAVADALKHVSLSTSQVERLRAVVLRFVDSRYEREFRRYCRLARTLDTPKFREDLARLAASRDPDVARRAGWVLSALR